MVYNCVVCNYGVFIVEVSNGAFFNDLVSNSVVYMGFIVEWYSS